MKNEINGLSLTIIGLIIAAIGVIAPIAWDWWNKKSELNLEVSNSVTIIKKENSIQDLKIYYAGKEISSLTKNTLTLKNTGRTPISKDDVISNILVKIEDGTLLEASKVKEDPENINASITLKDNGFNISFDLLNPNDEIDISILSSGINPRFNPEARIKNIPSILLSSPSDNYQIQKT